MRLAAIDRWRLSGHPGGTASSRWIVLGLWRWQVAELARVVAC